MTDLKIERCVLCLDKKRSPVTVECGHSFCRKCLDQYKSYRKHTWAKKCPICRSEFKQKKRGEKGTSSALHTTSSSDPAANTMSENNLLEQFIAIATSDVSEANDIEYVSADDDNLMEDDDSDEDMFYYFEDDVSLESDEPDDSFYDDEIF